MTRSIRGSRRGAALLLAGTAAAASLLLSGCGAGQVAETANKIPSVQGINVQTSDNLYKVRGLYVQYPGSEGYQAGANARLNVVLYNDSQSPVTVTVTTDSAKEIVLSGAAESGGPSVAPTGSPTEPATASPTASDPSASPSQSLGTSESPSASPSASPSESAPAGQPARIEIPANGYVALSGNGGQFLQLVGLNEQLRSGQQVNLTFDFGDGKVIKTGAPVGVPLTPAPAPSQIVHPREEAGEQAGVEGGGHG
ncbi:MULTISPECIES: copper chaperone PCu(A)C [Micromonospora]|uniref:Copper chaperone PCu(A)C n=1 Tax=Micromonospora solifontis TaxID=2487138 RepID=A0ABX9WHN5_9ACTN|nr:MULTISPECIES: copper chaperone PCu(A)C [Micromonospora]NES14675.1 copper chaperone PCu(A)C [Micromonospora sp. PPF5-17B]NES36657.1 copper chaperone PCu(A)C [Micromonospora solifontis]NES55683.1 copper chaperone PCu(A)C [Micromonospora sp. PPF5-6]RNL99251.1 copper chaperone PCu(A)C [Micromonospora solifontis]